MAEMFISLSLAATSWVGLAGVLMSEWDRARCSVVAFESAHRGLTEGERGRSFPFSPGRAPQVRLSETSWSVVAEARCGRAIERVELIKLEAAKW